MGTENRLEDESCSLGPGPFIFSGTPPLITGTVNVINKSAEKAKLRTVAMDSPQLTSFRALRMQQKKGKEVKAALKLSEVRVFGRLGPFDQANLPAQLSIDRLTPPGEYEARVSFGQQEEQAVVIVLENYDLRVVPSRITITAEPGETIQRAIYFTNEGNMTFSTRKAAFAPLQALDMLHKSLAISLLEEGDKGYEKVLDRLAQLMSEAEVQPAKVKIDIQDQEIAPGETKRVDITLRLPADLKRKQTYTSNISFRNARLSIELDVNGNSKPKERSR